MTKHLTPRSNQPVPIYDNETVWVTREGLRIQIRNLEDDHIRSIIRMDSKDLFPEEYRAKLEIVKTEAAQRGIFPVLIL